MSLSVAFLNAKVLFCLCVTLLFQLHFTLSASNPSGLTLRAFVDDSPNSPLYRIENLTKTERIERLIKVTHARANYLHKTWSLDARVDSISTRIPLLRDSLFYAVEFTMGSQEHRVKLLMDTGGGLTWTQCADCLGCFNQTLPMFDRRQSTTYQRLPCSHPLCQGRGSPFACDKGQCTYYTRYGGGTFTAGIASLETFHFPVGSFNNIIFGCTLASGKVYYQNTDISGIFGLGMFLESMTTQFSLSKFSYCLAPFFDAIPRPLVLRIGEDVRVLPPQGSQITEFATVPGRSYFYLQLVDISVSTHRIGFPPNTFKVRPNGRGGCMIDSGALYTAIDTQTPNPTSNAHLLVIKLFERYYEGRQLKRKKGPFELCYDLPQGYNDFASLTFHFSGGADYIVNGRYVHLFYPGSFCVAIIPNNDQLTILGAWQQQNKRIIYDLGMKGLQFADEQCINDVP